MVSAIHEERKIYSVSALNQQVRMLLETRFDGLWIDGEISNFKHYPSGHMYFSLKDRQAQIRAVMFAGRNRYLTFTPKDGMQVLLKAKASLYEDRGDYQLLVDYMEEAGDGALKRAFEILKQKLASEGLFDQSRKKVPPALPHCIGLVTSSKGAAVHDILTTLARRFPAIPVIIYPAQVQGAQAPQEIAKAIQLANLRGECDVLIVGRGGGSLEDLQAFNTEIVARAIYSSIIPVISAVGHEVDVTIADFVADIRAATPTAAAELVSPDRQVLFYTFKEIEKKLKKHLFALIQQKMQEVDWLSRQLKHPKQRLDDYQSQLQQLQKLLFQAIQHRLLKQTQLLTAQQTKLEQQSPLRIITIYQHRLAFLCEKMKQALQNRVQQDGNTLSIAAARLDSMSPLKTLDRGYSILFQAERNEVIHSIKGLKKGDKIKAQVSDGTISCEILDIL